MLPHHGQSAGPFTVWNVPNEKALLLRWFQHMREARCAVYVTYNGDYFDWPFMETRSMACGMDMHAELGFKFGKKSGECLSRWGPKWLRQLRCWCCWSGRAGAQACMMRGQQVQGRLAAHAMPAQTCYAVQRLLQACLMRACGLDRWLCIAGCCCRLWSGRASQESRPHPLCTPSVHLHAEGSSWCRTAVHMDCMHWVNRDSYLPQGSRGLKAVTRVQAGLRPRGGRP